MIAKLRVVPRVVLFSAVPDTVAGLGAPTWETGHATASERYWGLVHERDPSFHAMTASWHALGMDAFGRRVRVEESGPPYELTHTLTTDLLPKSGSYTVPPNGSHGSTAWDDSTPIASDGTPLLRDAWRYLLTAEASDDEPEEE